MTALSRPSFVLMIAALVLLEAQASAADVYAASMSKRGNVRYGPSTDAEIIVTLSVGTPVQVLGRVPGRDDWYIIRFPRQGHAWMHARNLELRPDGRSYEVTAEVANVRADSRVNAELVDQVVRGEVVEWKDVDPGDGFTGRQVGDWIGVYPPDAVAYVYHTVLDLREAPARVTEARPDPRDARAHAAIEQRWRDAAETYRRYRTEIQADPDAALSIDWRSLDNDLAAVVERHPDTRTRLTAQQVRAAISRLADYIRRVRAERGLAPAVQTLPDLSAPAPIPTDVEQPVVADPQPRDPTPPAIDQQPVAVDPQPVDAEPATGPVTVDLEPVAEPEPAVAEPVVAPAIGNNELVGWVATQDVQGSPTTHVLIGTDGEVAALLDTPAGSAITLSEFYWRQVRVSGSSQPFEVSVAGVSKSLPLITVQSILMNRQ